MDLYQLARIFKKFNVKPGDNQPVEPRYIISYTGDAHSNLRSALKTLGFDFVKNAKTIGLIQNTQCVDVRGLVPLFPNF